MPHLLELRDWPDFLLRQERGLFEDAPDERKILRAEFGISRDTGQSGCGLAQRDAVLIAPGCGEVIGKVGGLAEVEINDALDGVFIAIGFDEHRSGAEGDAIRGENHVVADFVRGLEVLVDQGGRHGERFAGVVEAGLIGGVDGELAGGLDIDAGEVANCVVVFGVAEAAGEDGAGIAGVLAGFIGAHGLDPVDYLLAGFVGRRGHGGRGHLLRGELVDDEGPALVVLNDGIHAGVRGEIELGGGGFAAVASDAILGDEGAHDFGELAIEDGVGRFGNGDGGDGDNSRGQTERKL